MLLSAGLNRVAQGLLYVQSGYRDLCSAAGPPQPQPAAAAPAGLNITVYRPGVPFAPAPLPPPGASADGEEIARQLALVTRDTAWALVGRVPLEGDTFEPEGLVRLGADRYLVSAGEYTARTERRRPGGGRAADGADRTAGAGFGHLIVFDGAGRRIADATLTRAGDAEYHNGGLDYDGAHVWATLSQYRPDSTATVVRVDPATLAPEPVLRAADHQGAAVRDLGAGTLVTLNWGGRAAATWDLRGRPAPPGRGFARPRAVVANPSHWVDYQDCKYLGRSRARGRPGAALCGGIAAVGNATVGGVAVVDLRTMRPLWEVPLAMVSEAGNLVTKNPLDVALVGGRVRLYFLPDERKSTLYVYEPQI